MARTQQQHQGKHDNIAQWVDLAASLKFVSTTHPNQHLNLHEYSSARYVIFLDAYENLEQWKTEAHENFNKY